MSVLSIPKKKVVRHPESKFLFQFDLDAIAKELGYSANYIKLHLYGHFKSEKISQKLSDLAEALRTQEAVE